MPQADVDVRPPVPPDPMLRPDGSHAGRDWSLDPGVRHLNHGSYGAVPLPVSARQQALRDEAERDPVAWFRHLPARVSQARRALADWLDAPQEATALVPNASAGVTSVLVSLPLSSGARVVMTDHTYGAVEMAVQRYAARAGARVDTVHIPLAADAEETAALIREAMDAGPRTELVVVDQITSATARLMPVQQIAADCRDRGIALLVDGAHAPGMIARPLAGLAGSYWVGNLHKWPCAPRGTAVLVAQPCEPDDRQRLHPPIDSWGAPEAYPQRFDQQGTLDLTAWLAAPQAVDFVGDRYGWETARAHFCRLVEYGQQYLADCWGARLDQLPPEPAPAMRLVPLPAGVATDQAAAHALQYRIADELGCATAVTSWRGRGFLRLSAHLYNTADDYHDFAARCEWLTH